MSINILSKWKEFFGNKQKMLLFLTFILFFPIPFFAFIMAGIVPVGFLLVFPFMILIGGFDIIVMIIISAIDLIFLFIIFYLFRYIINKIVGFYPKFSQNQKNYWIFTLIICFVLILVSMNINYTVGDVGGGVHKFKFIEFIKDPMSI